MNPASIRMSRLQSLNNLVAVLFCLAAEVVVVVAAVAAVAVAAVAVAAVAAMVTVVATEEATGLAVVGITATTAAGRLLVLLSAPPSLLPSAGGAFSHVRISGLSTSSRRVGMAVFA